MDLPGQTGTINPYENNSLNSDLDDNTEQRETRLNPEYSVVYEVASITDVKDDQTDNDMTNNPAYISRKYNRLFSCKKETARE